MLSTSRRNWRQPALEIALAVALGGAACSSGPEDSEPDAAVIPNGPAVGELIDSGCSTEVVVGISLQVIEEIACMDSQSLVEFQASDRLSFASGAVLPFVSAQARDDLQDAVAAGPGTLIVTSAFRTVVQQYLLVQWFGLGRCGITAAATPGRSNHESGRAIDVSNFAEWTGTLPTFDWDQTVPGDPVHFDHVLSPDIRGMDVQAFQRLWNRNNPDDRIDEDGLYGPQTEVRIEQAPANGFALGPECATALTEQHREWLEQSDRQPALAPRHAH